MLEAQQFQRSITSTLHSWEWGGFPRVGVKRLEFDGEETAELQSMTSENKRNRKLHHRGNLISSDQLSDARQPEADASRLAVTQTAQQIAEKFGKTPEEAFVLVVKRRKWEVKNRWSWIQRNTSCHLQGSQEN